MKSNVGFTIIELMVTIGVVAILAAAAGPSFATLMKNNRLTTNVNQLIGGLTMMRSEAIKRGVNVSMCRSANGAACGGNWENGWIVFTDGNTPGAVDGTDQVLLVQGPLAGEDSTLTGNAALANDITYQPDGTSNRNDTFTLCDDRGSPFLRAVAISNAGRARLVTNIAGLTCP